MRTENDKNVNELRIGYYSSIFLAVITLIAFGFAMTAIPPSGPYCPGNCMEYPFLDSLNYYPRDYYWMYFACLQLITFIIFVISIHFVSAPEKKIYSFIGISFSMVTSVILLADYFIQFAVVPISFMKGETEGIGLLSQYNGHGIFIALEELGFIMMSLSLLFIAPVFSRQIRFESWIWWILKIPITGIVVSFVYYNIKYGIDRSYRFEVAAITFNWLILIVVGILAGVYFKRKLKLAVQRTGLK